MKIINEKKGHVLSLSEGFTIIELMVSIAIMVVILSVILVNYKKFDSGIVMTNLSYDIALSIRTAQTYGVSTKGANGAFDKPYGIHFDTTLPANSYTLFADLNANGVYDDSSEGSIATKYNLRGAYYIKKVCWLDNVLTPKCSPENGNSVDITFKRPDPDAKLKFNSADQIGLSAVEIYLGSNQDAKAEKVITVRPTGQISVK